MLKRILFLILLLMISFFVVRYWYRNSQDASYLGTGEVLSGEEMIIDMNQARLASGSNAIDPNQAQGDEMLDGDVMTGEEGVQDASADSESGSLEEVLQQLIEE
ncbi:MAG TPA: hypothetical protein PKC14_00265 [Candidatus Absconditabacterales bacterium]|nr:hypothetical protein [Candidatus Absconditabacterales bacterium]